MPYYQKKLLYEMILRRTLIRLRIPRGYSKSYYWLVIKARIEAERITNWILGSLGESFTIKEE